MSKSKIITSLFLLMLCTSIFSLAQDSPSSSDNQDYEEGDEVSTTTANGFGPSQQTSATTNPLSFFSCLDTQQCKQLDEVWALRISSFVNPIHNSQAWDVFTQPPQWKSFQDLYTPQPFTPSSPNAPSTSPFIEYPQSGNCLTLAFSNSQSEDASKRTSINFQGQSLSVNKIIAPLFKQIDLEITAAHLSYSFSRLATGKWRCVNSPIIHIINPTTCETNKGKIARSKHSFGIAIDINPAQNPFCTKAADNKYYQNSNECHPTIPPEVVAIFKSHDFRWGGDWDNAKDYMHFDWKGNIGDFNGDGTIESCGTQPTPTSPSSPAPSTSSPTAPTGKAWEQYTTQQAWYEALTLRNIQGKTVITKIPSNGKDDAFNRIDTGRDTILFAPATTDFTKPVDILYFFHGLGGFGLDMYERVIPQAKILSEKNKNVVIIFPELPWSRGTFSEDKPNSQNPRIQGRESLAWNGQDSNFLQFHQDILQILNQQFANNNFQKGKIILVGHSNGGSALGQAAKQGALNSINPDVITFSDADYKWQSQLAAQNVWDNYVKNNPQVELNLLVQSSPDAEGQKPFKYAQEFLSANNFVLNSNQQTQHFPPNLNYVPLTRSELQTLPVTTDSPHRKTPDTSNHAYIARMSIVWTMTHDQTLSVTS